MLSEQGFKEVMLFGQNVNSYADTSEQGRPMVLVGAEGGVRGDTGAVGVRAEGVKAERDADAGAPCSHPSSVSFFDEVERRERKGGCSQLASPRPSPQVGREWWWRQVRGTLSVPKGFRSVYTPTNRELRPNLTSKAQAESSLPREWAALTERRARGAPHELTPPGCHHSSQ
jgi:hypothetical protein